MRRKIEIDNNNVAHLTRNFRPHIHRLSIDPSQRVHPAVLNMLTTFPISITIVDSWYDDGILCHAVSVQLNAVDTKYAIAFHDTADFHLFINTLNDQAKATEFAELMMDVPFNKTIDPYIRVAV